MTFSLLEMTTTVPSVWHALAAADAVNFIFNLIKTGVNEHQGRKLHFKIKAAAAAAAEGAPRTMNMFITSFLAVEKGANEQSK